MKTYTAAELAEFSSVPGYENYLVSPSGEVIGPKGRKLQASLRKDGYLQVVLFDRSGKRRSMKIHRIVASAYIPQQTGMQMVNHLDGDKSNNSVAKLEWCDASRNTKHAYINRLISPATGERHGSAKLKAVDVEQIRAIGEFLSTRELARRYHVSPAAIQKILKWETWTNYTAAPGGEKPAETEAA